MIGLKNITKSYEGKAILQNVTISIPEGSMVFLMGQSGKGKTTLLRLMMGLEKPDSGTILGIDPHQLSVVFQEDRLCMGISAKKNIEIACPQVDSATIERHLLEVGLLLEEIHKSVSQYSGGMRRRVALVRCILAKSNCMLMDEPFQGLDEHTKELCMDYVIAHREERTAILVTHDKKEAEYMKGILLEWNSVV